MGVDVGVAERTGLDLVTKLYGHLFSSASIVQTPGGDLLIESVWGRYVMWAVAFLVLLPLSRWCWRRGIGGHFAPGVFIASFAIPMIIVPSIASESVRVSPGGISLRTGLWFAPTRYTYSFAGMSEVVETNERVRQRRLPRWDRFWTFHYQSGRDRRLDLPDLLDGNRAPVIAYLRSHGIRFREG